MAIIDAEQISKAAQGFSRLSIVQQLTVLIGISLSIALGVSVALWSSKPNLVPMYAQLDPSDTAQVIDVLQKSDIDYEYSQGNGTVLVPANMVYELRMKLAAQGLPKSSTGGYELLDKPQGFGTSQYMESIKVRRSMEGELAKTITGLESVRNARVHLGMAKQSSFIRKSSVSSAAVMVELIPGYILDRGQVMGIVNLVSASVPGLDKNSVSVVDQRGNLLTGAKAENGAVATEQLDYVKQRESELSHKILKLLEPIYGKNAVMASVNADLDFTYNEITSENYEHDNPAVRKESTAQEGGGRSGQSGGVPGALSNSPPKAATTSSGSSQDTNEDFSEQSEPSGNYRIQTNRQYEVDRSIKYTKQMTGKVLRVTTAVVINDKVSYDQNANPTFTPIDPDEISRIESLVKDAVGFNAERGDTISVINSSFAKQPPMIEDPNLQTPMYKQDWFTTLVKQILSGVLIIIIMLSFIKPLINGIINSKKNDINEMNSKNSSSQGNSLELEDKDEMLQLPGPDEKVL
ncbi:MAG: flagellar M-ring protein FliF, partial [Francisellaceae bacterium]|nr:flagellar M-ring protein FliF [Francisellaceae bacterium]